MRILIFALGLTAAASTVMANPPGPHVSPASASAQHGNPHTTAPTGKPTTATAPPATSGTKPGSTAATTTTTRTTTTTALNPIAAKITANQGLSSKVSGMLATTIDPKTGQPITLNAASMGFKNSGQFVAALHVSRNLGVPFLSLKNAMVTARTSGSVTTSSQTGSLGQAIQKVKGAPDATAAATGEKEADDDLRTTTSASMTSGTTTTPTKKTGGQ